MEAIVRHGIGVSPGIAIGPAFVLERRRAHVSEEGIVREEIDAELERLDAAVDRAVAELDSLKDRTGQILGKGVAQIFDAQLLLLEDPMFVGAIRERVTDRLQNAEWAVQQVGKSLSAQVSSLADVYLRERGTDIDDLQERLLRALAGEEGHRLEMIDQPVVLFAHDLTPSETAQLDPERVLAFATDIGGRTSHTAIVARSLEIPAVVGLHDVTSLVQAQDTVVIDGEEGMVAIRPSTTLLKEYGNKKSSYAEHREELLQTRDLESITPDGFRVRLTANVENRDDLPSALEHGAEGVGLFRSEFLYLRNPGQLPSEEEHYEEYRGVLEKMSPRPVTIRTLDLGGEKILGDHGGDDQGSSLLGLRALRLALREREIFVAQLRGLLRASVHGDLRIMLPFVSGLDELREAKMIIAETRDELIAAGHQVAPEIPIGVMIEVPSAALVVDLLAAEADFLSVGSNDLIQYLLAVDRTNDAVADLYEPLHPAVLRLLGEIVEGARRRGIPLSMCGEMASDPLTAMVLLGFGFEELSMNSVAIPLVKNVVRRVKRSEAEKIVEHALCLGTGREVEEYAFEKLMTLFPDGFVVPG